MSRFPEGEPGTEDITTLEVVPRSIFQRFLDEHRVVRSMYGMKGITVHHEARGEDLVNVLNNLEIARGKNLSTVVELNFADSDAIQGFFNSGIFTLKPTFKTSQLIFQDTTPSNWLHESNNLHLYQQRVRPLLGRMRTALWEGSSSWRGSRDAKTPDCIMVFSPYHMDINLSDLPSVRHFSGDSANSLLQLFETWQATQK